MSNETLTAEQKKALFETFEKERAKLAKANAGVDAAVKNIAEQIGVGPFKWQGEVLHIVRRGERMMMKSNASDVEEIG